MHKSLLRTSLACAALLLLFAPQIQPAIAQVDVAPQDTSAIVGDTVSVAIEAGDLSQSNVASYQFTATYDGNVVEVIGADTENTLSSEGDLEVNTDSSGEVRVAFASSDSLGGPGTLLNLRTVLRAAGRTTVDLEEARFFNQNGQEVTQAVDVGSGTVESAVEVTLPSLQVLSITDSLEIPVDVGNLTGAGATSYQFTLTYDPDVIDVTDATAEGTLSEGQQLEFNKTAPGEVKVAFASSGAPLEGPGTLLEFRATTEGVGTSPLSTGESFLIGGSDVPTSITEGSVQVTERSPISVDIDQSFGDAEDQSNYRLVALPGQVNLGIESTLAGEPGEFNDWRVFWDDGSSTTQEGLVEFDGSSTFNFQSGRGFWVLSRNNWAVSQEFQPVPLSDGNASIPLHDGWNIISNPLGKNVSWSSVQSVNGISQPLWSFTGSFNQESTFRSAQSGQAFYFFNDQGLDELLIPFFEGSSSATVAAKRESAQTLRIDALVDGKKASSVWVGTHPSAETGEDRLDNFSPPGYFTDATLAVANGEIDSKYSLASDFRPAGARGHEYNLSLQVKNGGKLTLRARGLSDLGSGKEVRLYNNKNGRSFDLRSNSTVQIDPSSETAEFTLLVGTSSYVNQESSEIVPEKLDLRQYPNPIRPEGQPTIEYALPDQMEVSVKVYDVLGRRVRTLVSGEEQRAGVHTIRWDARGGQGQALASGVYFARLTAGGQTRTVKMVVVE